MSIINTLNVRLFPSSAGLVPRNSTINYRKRFQHFYWIVDFRIVVRQKSHKRLLNGRRSPDDVLMFHYQSPTELRRLLLPFLLFVCNIHFLNKKKLENRGARRTQPVSLFHSFCATNIMILCWERRFGFRLV